MPKLSLQCWGAQVGGGGPQSCWDSGTAQGRKLLLWEELPGAEAQELQGRACASS